MSNVIWKWQTTQPEARIDRAVAEAITSGHGSWEGAPLQVSRSQIQRLISLGNVLVDGNAVRSNFKIPPGSQVEVRFPAPEPIELVPEERELEILFEDSHLLVLNKPPGLTVHPSSTQKKATLVHALLHHVKDLSGIGGELRPGIVHRIDKDTSGALVITKTDQAHRKLVEVFSKHDIERVYWAICYGTTSQKEATISGKIGRNPSDRKKMAVLDPGNTTGRNCVTHFKRVEQYAVQGQKPFACRLEVRLETGRTHQIRVHMTSISHSLLGDPVYGTPTKNQTKWKSLPSDIQELVAALPGQALHARTLGFRHPVTGEMLRFEAAPPPALAALMSALADGYGTADAY
jgi:23S rRNA pseudouridine1911/1915/1917 synthase